MDLLTHLQPRDHRAATRVVSILCAIGVGVTVVFLPIAPGNDLTPNPVLAAVAGVSFLSVILLSAAAWFFDEASRVAWALSPFLAIAAIVTADLATHDASVSAQIFFLFPTLYCASLLPRYGAAMVMGAVVLGELIVVFTLLPVRQAIFEGGYVSAALVATAAMLVRGAEAQVALTAELEHRASTDSLTGLVTRRAFDEAASSALETDPSDDGTALILLDVDLFKSVNDRYGHPGGDEVLVQLAELLVEASRRGDVVCRLGGDEMAVLLPGCSVEVAHRRAEEMIREVRTHGFVLSIGSIINVSVSAGLAHSPTHAHDPRALYVAADQALYEAKRSGRNRVVAQPSAV